MEHSRALTTNRGPVPERPLFDVANRQYDRESAPEHLMPR